MQDNAATTAKPDNDRSGTKAPVRIARSINETAERARTERAAERAWIARAAYSINEIAERSGKSRTTIYAEIRARRLKTKRLGSRQIVTPEAERAWLDGLPDGKAAA